jgi:hypothetical protein
LLEAAGPGFADVERFYETGEAPQTMTVVNGHAAMPHHLDGGNRPPWWAPSTPGLGLIKEAGRDAEI